MSWDADALREVERAARAVARGGRSVRVCATCRKTYPPESRAFDARTNKCRNRGPCRKRIASLVPSTVRYAGTSAETLYAADRDALGLSA